MCSRSPGSSAKENSFGISSPFRRPRPRDRLKKSDKELARVLLVVGALVGIAEHGRRAGEQRHGLRHDVIVFRGVQRERHSQALCDLATP